MRRPRSPRCCVPSISIWRSSTSAGPRQLLPLLILRLRLRPHRAAKPRAQRLPVPTRPRTETLVTLARVRTPPRMPTSQTPSNRRPPDDAVPDRTIPDRAATSRTAPKWTVRSRRLPDGAMLDQTVPGLAAANRTVPKRTVCSHRQPDGAMLDRTILGQAATSRTAPKRTVPHQGLPDGAVLDRTVPGRAATDRRVLRRTVRSPRLLPDGEVPDRTVPGRVATNRTVLRWTVHGRRAANRTVPDHTASGRTAFGCTAGVSIPVASPSPWMRTRTGGPAATARRPRIRTRWPCCACCVGPVVASPWPTGGGSFLRRSPSRRFRLPTCRPRRSGTACTTAACRWARPRGGCSPCSSVRDRDGPVRRVRVRRRFGETCGRRDWDRERR